MTRPLHTACCALALACLPAIAADNTRDDIQPADLVHILIGAYEGAADAADRSGHPFGGERLSHEDLVRLEANVQQLQQGLRDITKADATATASPPCSTTCKTGVAKAAPSTSCAR